jgi:hypothetical protein
MAFADTTSVKESTDSELVEEDVNLVKNLDVSL